MHDPLVGPHLAKLHILAQARSTGLSVSQWRAWLTGEYHCQIAEVAAFATMAARMPHDARAAAFFTELAQLILRGRPALLAAAAAVDLTERDLVDAPLRPGVHEFTGLVSWLALHGEAGEIALVVRHDWILYCAACAALATAVSQQAGAPETTRQYLEGYGTPPPQILDAASALADSALRDGASEARLTRSLPLAAITLEAFWDAILVA